MISFRSVKLSLTLWYTVILTVFLTLFAIFMHWELAKALYRDTDLILLNEARGLEESIAKELPYVFAGQSIKPDHRFFSTSLYFQPDVKAKLISRSARWEESNKKIARSRMMVRLLGLDHTTLSMNLKRWEEEVIFPDFERDAVFMERGESFQTIHFKKMPVRLYYRLVRHKGVPIFIIQCGESMQEVRNTLHRLSIIIFVSIPIAAAVACMAGWFMAKRSFQPLDVMVREARQITGTDVSRRLPRTNTGDELDRLAETLNEMMERVEASKKVVQEFSSNISHELKTPLAIVRGEIDLALRRSRTSEEYINTLKSIEGEVNELIRMVDDLIFLVRTDAHQLRFIMADVSLAEILKYVTDRFKERAAGKKIKIVADIPANMPLKGDAVYLKRVFNNLVDNAIKFTPENGKISVVATAKNKKAYVQVIDTGMGIDPEKIPKLFTRFYRTDTARQYEGSGLGLNIAKAICDAHGGSISIESVPTRGTTITVTLPLSK